MDEIYMNEVASSDKKSNKKVTKREYNSSRFEPEPVDVELPSKGWLYAGKFDDLEASKGIIKIRPLTLKEEKILTTDRLIRSGVALDLVLKNCIKSNVDPDQLLSSDRLYILFYLRGMSYGLSYDFNVRCYNCGSNFNQVVEIDKLPIKVWEKKEDAKEPIVIKLPFSKATVEAHYMRGYEEKDLVKAEQELVKFNEPDDAMAKTITMLIDKITLKDGEVLSPQDKSDFIDNMVAGDVSFFRETMNNSDCGIQGITNVICPHCGAHLDINIPLGRNFFRSRRPR